MALHLGTLGTFALLSPVPTVLCWLGLSGIIGVVRDKEMTLTQGWLSFLDVDIDPSVIELDELMADQDAFAAWVQAETIPAAMWDWGFDLDRGIGWRFIPAMEWN